MATVQKRMRNRRAKGPGSGFDTARCPFSVITFLVVTALIIVSYQPLLMPLLDNKLVFAYGDFSTIATQDSGTLRTIANYQTFSGGFPQPSNYRAFLLFGVSFITGNLGMTDSQTHSLIILICILLGAYGIYRLSGIFVQEEKTRSLLIATLTIFYFLNLWGVERIGHIWIWFSYAMFPLFLTQGMDYISTKKISSLAAYSALLGIFGIFPHNFIYLCIIHAFLLIYLTIKEGIARSIKFALIPLAFYLLLNIPVFITLIYTKTGYLAAVDTTTFDFLSRNGGLDNLFTFTNNWWPQVPDALVFDNMIFRLSGLGIFIGSFLLFLKGCGSGEIDRRLAVILAFLVISGIIFIAQGNNNPAITILLNWVEKTNLQEFAGPFREWERICIVIPVFLSLIITVGITTINSKMRDYAAGVMLLLVITNAASGPMWVYLDTVHAAVPVTNGDLQLMDRVSYLDKTLMISPNREASILGTKRYSWNPDKAVGSIYFEQYSGLYSDLTNYMAMKEPPENLVDNLDIRYVVKRTDYLNASGFNVSYGWMNCERADITVCFNPDNISAFRVYAGSVYTVDDPARAYSLSYLNQDRYAPSPIYDNSTKYVLMDNALNMTPIPPGMSDSILYVSESNRDFKLNGTNGVIDDGWGLLFEQNAAVSGTMDVIDDGTYVIGFRGSGVYNLTVGGKDFTFNSSTIAYSYSEPFNLTKGTQGIVLSAENSSYFDTLWLFPLKSGGNIGYINDSSDSPATITGSSRPSQTLAKVSINATGPFLLSFAETYDPQWEARVYKNGQLIESVKPIPLYGTISGYWINATGNGLDVEIVYTPQSYFDAGLLVTAITLIVCFAAMIGVADGK